MLNKIGLYVLRNNNCKNSNFVLLWDFPLLCGEKWKHIPVCVNGEQAFTSWEELIKSWELRWFTPSGYLGLLFLFCQLCLPLHPSCFHSSGVPSPLPSCVSQSSFIAVRRHNLKDERIYLGPQFQSFQYMVGWFHCFWTVRQSILVERMSRTELFTSQQLESREKQTGKGQVKLYHSKTLPHYPTSSNQAPDPI
jgi:hypothetical protein